MHHDTHTNRGLYPEARRCHRCGCTNYAEAIETNPRGHVILCTVCNAPTDKHLEMAQSAIEDAISDCQKGYVQDSKYAINRAMQYLQTALITTKPRPE